MSNVDLAHTPSAELPVAENHNLLVDTSSPLAVNDNSAAAALMELTSPVESAEKEQEQEKEKENGAPVGAIRSLSGTPSMERESERPDAEGGYENDQPAPLVNPPLYAQA